MWNLVNKINKQNRNTFLDKEETDSCQEGRVLQGWVKNVKGLRKENHSVTDNSMVITRRKEGWGGTRG